MSGPLSQIDRIRALREAGHVDRAHCFPKHGTYSVGRHSYDALSILLVLHPGPSVDLIKAVLWHDAGERYMGDLPATVKWNYPELRQTYEAEENRVACWMGCPLGELGKGDLEWLAAVDALEFLLWCHDQVAMGNRNLAGAQDLIEQRLRVYHSESRLPPETLELVRYLVYLHKTMGRSDEESPWQ